MDEGIPGPVTNNFAGRANGKTKQPNENGPDKKGNHTKRGHQNEPPWDSNRGVAPRALKLDALTTRLKEILGKERAQGTI